MDHIYLDDNYMLSGRWGMVFGVKLMGTANAVPFLDRFLALALLVMAAVLLCYVLYSVGRNKNVLPYTITASVFITYPLINEIWEYTGADYMVGGNLSLVTVAFIILKESSFYTLLWKRCMVASALILLPISSYETAIFYYFTLVCCAIFYENVICRDTSIDLRKWLKLVCYYAIPVIIAVVARFVISFAINIIYGLQYHGGGAVSILWLENGFLQSLKCMIVFNMVNYGLYGLVYFPITIFVISLVVFLLYVLKDNRKKTFMLGCVIVISLFSQSIIQGYELSYRHAQTITLFVAFVTYLICISVKKKKYVFLSAVLFFLCWHQAVYLNRILGLNNLRSENELAAIRQIGSRIISEYERKPVVLVSQYPMSDYIQGQVSVDESKWNGKLFLTIYDKITIHNRPFRYVGNCQSASWEHYQVQELFRYCGYDITILPNLWTDGENGAVILAEAVRIAKRQNMKPYQIYDNDNYLVVTLGNDYYI